MLLVRSTFQIELVAVFLSARSEAMLTKKPEVRRARPGFLHKVSHSGLGAHLFVLNL